jgi:uncharacterized protein YlaI
MYRSRHSNSQRFTKLASLVNSSIQSQNFEVLSNQPSIDFHSSEELPSDPPSPSQYIKDLSNQSNSIENRLNFNSQNNESLLHNVPKEKTTIDSNDQLLLENEIQRSSSRRNRSISTTQESDFDSRIRIKVENKMKSSNFTLQTSSNKNNRIFTIPLSILRQNKKLLFEPKPIVKRPILRKRKLFHLTTHQRDIPLHSLQVM